MLELSRRIVWICGVATFLLGVSMAVAQDRPGVEVKTDQASRRGLPNWPSQGSQDDQALCLLRREGSGVDVQRPLLHGRTFSWEAHDYVQ